MYIEKERERDVSVKSQNWQAAYIVSIKDENEKYKIFFFVNFISTICAFFYNNWF